jgi:hypothetical protein
MMRTLTESTNNERNEEPRFRLDHLEQMQECCQSKQDHKDDGCDHGRVIFVELEVLETGLF